MAKPVVTAIVDTHNHERFIEEAIVSVLEQDFPQARWKFWWWMMARPIAPQKSFANSNRVCACSKANGGQASAFNAGIPEASGEFIAFLDGDDWWAEG